MIRGGFDGISLEVRGDQVGLLLEGVFVCITHLAWHVHPSPTGPSQHDFDVLAKLNQKSSVVYEINGEKPGTFFNVRGRS
jgi:hypothetical protein